MTTNDYPQLYIGGTWIAPAGHDTIEVHSAATEERIGSVPRGSEADIDAAVAAARVAFDAPDGWATWDPKERADLLQRFAVGLAARAVETARPTAGGPGILRSAPTSSNGSRWNWKPAVPKRRDGCRCRTGCRSGWPSSSRHCLPRCRSPT